MSGLTIFLIVLFGAWWVLSAVAQLPTAFSSWLQSLDVVNVIPRWNFFAPSPGTYDVHVLYRDRLQDGSVTDWHEIPAEVPPRFINPLWNPGRRHNKAVFDVTRHIADYASTHEGETLQIQMSMPYLVLLNFVSKLPRVYGARETQFLLMRSYFQAEFDEPVPIFWSSFHRLEVSGDELVPG